MFHVSIQPNYRILHIIIYIQILLPQTLGSERLDTVIESLSAMREKPQLTFDWSKIKVVEPAGRAIISILIDQAIEKDCLLIHTNLDSTLKKHHPLLKNLFKKDGLPKPQQHFYKDKNSFHLCCQGGIDLSYKEILLNEFSHKLDEDLLLSIQLVFNELIQNAVDHSTFLYQDKIYVVIQQNRDRQRLCRSLWWRM